MSVLVGDEWIEASTGSFVLLPGNVTHTFENRCPERAGTFNVSAPGNFEQRMPDIARWVRRALFRGHPRLSATQRAWLTGRRGTGEEIPGTVRAHNLYSGFWKSKRAPASHSLRWLPCAGNPPADCSILAR
jgi:hypothetical protein